MVENIQAREAVHWLARKYWLPVGENITQDLVVASSPWVMEHVSPGWVEDLTIKVDHRQVPVPVPDHTLQVSRAMRKEGSEGSSQPRTNSLKILILVVKSYMNYGIVHMEIWKYNDGAT